MSAASLKQAAENALDLGFRIFPLQPKSKLPYSGSNGFKDASFQPGQIESWWNQRPDSNIGIALGESNLCVLDFDKEGSVPDWVKQTRTLKVKTAKGLHVYFYGSRKTGKMYVNGECVGDIKSEGGYVLAAGSVHPDGPIYTTIETSPIANLPGEVCQLEKPTDGKPGDSATEIFRKGGRNTGLAAIAGHLRKGLASPEEIETTLLRINREQCDPALADDEVKTIAASISRYKDEIVNTVLIDGDVPGAVQGATSETTPDLTKWRSSFRKIGELEDGDVRMLINDFLPEGISFIGALPGETKTLFALSIAKALTTKRPLLGNPEWAVPVSIPVLYMIPESSGRAFKSRCKIFGIPDDEKLFLCRTISEGATLGLSNPLLQEAVRQMKPFVILDTLIRFSEADDENNAAQNKQLADDVVLLRQMGAVGVMGLHHSTKALRNDGMTMENVLRGTGDLAALADAIYGLKRDDKLYADGSGPLEVEVRCVKPRDIKNPPTPFRMAASRKVEPGDGTVVVGQGRNVVSVINERGDFQLIRQAVHQDTVDRQLEDLVIANPEMTVTELNEATGHSAWIIKQALKRKGWIRPRGKNRGWLRGDATKSESTDQKEDW